jgi:FtsH-binding integral membrane protein
MSNHTRSPFSLGSGAWPQGGEESISRNAFLGITGGLTVYSLLLNAGLTMWSVKALTTFGLLPMLALMILPFLGSMLVNRTSSALWAMVGLHLVVVPFGLLLGPIIATYIRAGAFDIVQRAMVLTGCVTGIMTVLGLMYPRAFSRLGGVLMGGLIALLIIRVLQIFMTSLQGATWVEWLAAGIFTLYLGYYWHKASVVTTNLRNAIALAVGLYISILNLFLTILRLLSNRRN